MRQPISTVSRLAALALIASPGLLLLPALAGDPPSREVKVSVVAILASKQEGKTDERLTCLAREIRKANPHLKSFQFAKMTCRSIRLRGPAESFDLFADQKALVTVLKPADRDNHVELKVSPPTMGEITYTTCCGKFFPIITRYETANKEILILAVRVQPCHKEKKKKK
jgi:hypothetical protein